MLKKKFFVLLFTLVLIAGLVTAAQAFSVGTTDGVWGTANPGGDPPSNVFYHSGPMPSSSTNFSTTNCYSRSYIDQSGAGQSCYYRASGTGAGAEGTYDLPANDWNMVSYGSDLNGVGGSRLAWLGSTNVGGTPALNTPFLLGKFCHVNQPISATTTLENVALNMKIEDIKCDTGWHLQPIAGEDGIPASRDITFVYDFGLDETTNGMSVPRYGHPEDPDERCYSYGTGDCLCLEERQWPYQNRYWKICKYHSAAPDAGFSASPGWPIDGGGGCRGDKLIPHYSTKWTISTNDLNYNGCADKLSMTANSASASFTCVNDANPTVTREYTVSLLGTIPAPTNSLANDCSTSLGEGSPPLDFNVKYTAEQKITCTCAYGAVTLGNITPVEIINFMALGSTEGIKLSWETTAETDNLGFNIYRSTSLDGERELVNEIVIISDSPGGGMGATYEYMDTTVPAGITYYYWLRDIPLDDTIEPVDFGPLEALRPLN